MIYVSSSFSWPLSLQVHWVINAILWVCSGVELLWWYVSVIITIRNEFLLYLKLLLSDSACTDKSLRLHSFRAGDLDILLVSYFVSLDVFYVRGAENLIQMCKLSGVKPLLTSKTKRIWAWDLLATVRITAKIYFRSASDRRGILDQGWTRGSWKAGHGSLLSSSNISFQILQCNIRIWFG